MNKRTARLIRLAIFYARSSWIRIEPYPISNSIFHRAYRRIKEKIDG